ncbi:MAG: hypothetical protein JSV05_01645, partial [Candidatus Bathyarchaeota archaeon]
MLKLVHRPSLQITILVTIMINANQVPFLERNFLVLNNETIDKGIKALIRTRLLARAARWQG